MTEHSTAASASRTELIAVSIIREVLTICPVDEALDELVHTTAENCEGASDVPGEDCYDQANAKAASINNDGFVTQIKYLLNNGVSEADILQALSSAKTDE